jgi:hypothetical protein
MIVPAPMRVTPRPALALACLLLAGTSCRTGARTGVKPADLLPATRPAPEAPPSPPPLPAAPVAPPAPFVPPPAEAGASDDGVPLYVDGRDVGRLRREDWAAFNRAWALFVREDRSWPEARDAWLRRGGAAPYVLAENLLRYFWSATKRRYRTEVARVGREAALVGEPAVGYFANFLLLDSWPLKQPVRVKSSDGEERIVHEWENDDLTRRDLAIVLAAIGPPAVPKLSSEPFVRAKTPSARRYVLYALGRIATDTAVDAVASTLSDPSWQARGEATTALGLALPKNPRARPALERAMQDPDPFVRKQAAKALAGKGTVDF